MPKRRTNQVLVFDLGASSGRAMLAAFNGEKLVLKEIHRFKNESVRMNGTLYWDLPYLYKQITKGIIMADRITEGDIISLGIDTWGVDYCLTDERGDIISNPINYRDSRTSGILPRVYDKIPPERLYKLTGTQLMEINTAFQLYSAILRGGRLPENVCKLLLMPDLMNFLLTGKYCAEASIASTTGLVDAKSGDWSFEILDALQIPRDILPRIIPSGTAVGELAIAEELGVSPCEVTAVCGHDTECACAAIPASEKDFLFISCGTWSLFGTVTDLPIITEDSASLGISNEKGFGGKNIFLKNIVGLWLIQETKRYLESNGEEYSFAQLEELAEKAEPFRSFIDPDAPDFVSPGNVPERVREYCRRTMQPVPENIGQVLRCVYESLAMKYRGSAGEIFLCTGKTYRRIYMVGGGIQSTLLCRMTANACGLAVSAGPVEATAYGNAVIQLISEGVIPDIKTARRIISCSEDIRVYEPECTDEWDKAYERYKAVTAQETN